MDYKSFLEKKTIVSKDTGFTVNRKELKNN